jgi:pilus assembly protein Flp/PilA
LTKLGGELARILRIVRLRIVQLRIVRRVAMGNKEFKIMTRVFKEFLADETGATAIEYGLIAAGIALAIIAVINGLGSKLNTKFTSINTSLK